MYLCRRQADDGQGNGVSREVRERGGGGRGGMEGGVFYVLVHAY